MQTVKQSLVETAVKQVASFIINWALTYVLLIYVFGVQISYEQNFYFTVIMFVKSFLQEYGFRRWFNGRQECK